MQIGVFWMGRRNRTQKEAASRITENLLNNYKRKVIVFTLHENDKPDIK